MNNSRHLNEDQEALSTVSMVDKTSELNQDNKRKAVNKTRDIFKSYKNEVETVINPNPPPTVEPTPMPQVIFHVDSSSTLNTVTNNLADTNTNTTPGRRSKKVRQMEQSIKASDMDFKNYDIDAE